MNQLDQAKRGLIVKRFGSWLVTEYGLEHVNSDHTIRRSRLKSDWLNKVVLSQYGTMMDLADFSDALDCARFYHLYKNDGCLIPEYKLNDTGLRDIQTSLFRKSQISPKLRFLVMLRDGFRCKICGRNVEDGVKLEIDHKMPRSRGGDSSINNLQTACFDCNRGKSAYVIT